MFTVIKSLEISASHQLSLPYESKCENLHGHNWKITVFCHAEALDACGMVVDFSVVKRIIKDKMDHKHLNNVFSFNPTAENIAQWICDAVPNCYKVIVKESEDNTAIYEKD